MPTKKIGKLEGKVGKNQKKHIMVLIYQPTFFEFYKWAIDIQKNRKIIKYTHKVPTYTVIADDLQ